jgi:hypothetical protein
MDSGLSGGVGHNVRTTAFGIGARHSAPCLRRHLARWPNPVQTSALPRLRQRRGASRRSPVADACKAGLAHIRCCYRPAEAASAAAAGRVVATNAIVRSPASPTSPFRGRPCRGNVLLAPKLGAARPTCGSASASLVLAEERRGRLEPLDAYRVSAMGQRGVGLHRIPLEDAAAG